MTGTDCGAFAAYSGSVSDVLLSPEEGCWAKSWEAASNSLGMTNVSSNVNADTIVSISENTIAYLNGLRKKRTRGFLLFGCTRTTDFLSPENKLPLYYKTQEEQRNLMISQ